MLLALKAVFYTHTKYIKLQQTDWLGPFCTYNLCGISSSTLPDICEHAFCSVVKHNIIYNFYFCNSSTKLYLHVLTIYSENYVLNCGMDTEIFVRCVCVSTALDTTRCLNGLYITCSICNGQGLYSSQSETASYCCVSTRTKTGYIMTWLATVQMCLLLCSLKPRNADCPCVLTAVWNCNMLCISRHYLLV